MGLEKSQPLGNCWRKKFRKGTGGGETRGEGVRLSSSFQRGVIAGVPAPRARNEAVR